MRLESDNMNIPIWEKAMLTKQEAALYSHIGINKLEEMLKVPNCPFVLYVGKKKLIKRREFEDICKSRSKYRILHLSLFMI